MGSTIHLLYKSGSHVQVFHIYQQKTGMQGSRCLLVGTGVNFPDARLIHASIRVHPGWWVGYLQAAPLGMTFWRSWWATDLSPGEVGFASHWGILTLQFFGTPPSSLLKDLGIDYIGQCNFVVTFIQRKDDGWLRRGGSYGLDSKVYRFIDTRQLAAGVMTAVTSSDLFRSGHVLGIV